MLPVVNGGAEGNRVPQNRRISLIQTHGIINSDLTLWSTVSGSMFAKWGEQKQQQKQQEQEQSQQSQEPPWTNDEELGEDKREGNKGDGKRVYRSDGRLESLLHRIHVNRMCSTRSIACIKNR